ncbi:hypothetical protein ALP78_02123 [Pseudomonas coronafaciens pv. striafaciens]|uniref:Uncharacterized protein n=1 Tax=Pseudomonas coronafaciens pv. striafaciens TaxID=235276 RepID=A0A3M4YBU3_9PSED|nr:hypothetical protein ALP78_02123 [Pseudomonas coronafaciens pv. striafaciens]
MLPGPGFIGLIAGESPQRADQQARRPRRPQAHVDVIQLTGVGLRGQQMDHSLPQPGEELRRVDRFGTVGLGLQIAIMNEHQIQIGAVPQLDTADLAVADDHEARIAQRAVRTQRRTVTGHAVAPGQREHLIENRLGQPGQVITDFHQRQAAGYLGRRDAQAVRQLEMPQGLHLLLEIVLGDTNQPLAQLGRQFRGQRRIEQAPLVKQLIEQQRETRDLFGNPRAGGTQGQQLSQRVGVFREQHQVRRAPRDGLYQGQHALQYQVGLLMFHRLSQQTGDECVQPLTAQTLHRTQVGTAAQVGQMFQRPLGIDEAGLQQLATRGFFVLGLFPQRQPFASHHHFVIFILLVVRIGVGVSNDLAEVPGHTATPVHEPFVKGSPVSEAHDQRNARLILFVVRQHLRLTVGNRLNGVLGITQKLVALAQLFGHGRGQITLPLEGFQHFEQRPLLQTQVAAAVNKLKGLGDELHLANAAGTQLDVFRHALALHFLLNELLHGAQRFDGREIQIAAIHERTQHRQQFGTGRLIAPDHARLDHRVTFPVPALVLVILLQRIEAKHQRPGRTVRTQAHVDPEHETVDGHRVERLDQPLSQANEKFLIVQRTLGADGFAALRVAEDQVNVRGQVQFDRAKLAHAQNDHVLRLSGMTTGRGAELLAMPGVQPLVSQIDRRIGHVRQVTAGFDEICLTGQVAPDNPYLLACALST